MEAVTVVVPFTPGQPDRDRAWEWVRDKLEQTYPDWEIIVGTGDPERWVKADAVMPAVEAAKPGIVIVHDSDVWCDDTHQAVRAIEVGHTWAIPHYQVRRLTRASTGRLLAGEEPSRLPLDEPAYVGCASGGIVVAPRDTFLDIPLDPRFVGWGSEDRSWAMALRILLGGPWRGDTNLFHLWHPPQERMTRNIGSEQSHALRQRYEAVRENADGMRALLAEVKR